MFQLNRRQQIIVLIIACAIIFSLGYKLAQNKTVKPAVAQSAAQKTADQLIVHIAGAVEKPGVYHLPAGSRVIDGINRAGPSPEADLNALNLAAPLKDGEKTEVPFKAGDNGQSALPAANNTSPGTAVSAKTGPAPKTGTAAGKVNINTAGEAELDSLPGVGPALAQRIIQYRQEHGNFQTVEDLKNVSGIGDKKFSDLAGLISVN